MKTDLTTQHQESWPALPLEEWKDTYATLHMWTQIVGHIRTVLSPPINHFWHCTLYVTPRGLTTSAIPYENRIFRLPLISSRTSFPSRAVMALCARCGCVHNRLPIFTKSLCQR